MVTMEIHLRDLNEEAQAQALEFLGLATAAEGNLDVVPLFVLEREVPA